MQKAKDQNNQNATNKSEIAATSTSNNETIPEGLTPEEVEEYLKEKARKAYLANFRAQLPENKGHPRVN